MAAYPKSAGESLERYLRHWRERGVLAEPSMPQKIAQPMTIALSRERGVGAKRVANAIAQQLDWPVYDRELVERISKETGVQTQLLNSIDEKSPHWLTESLDSFRKEKTLGGSGFAIRLLKILFAISGHGDCILVGRGAAQVLPAKLTLRVRLIAPLEDRIVHIQEKADITSVQARKHAIEVDKERAAFVKSYFHKDVTDPHGYDLMINPLMFGVENTAEIITLAQKKYAEVIND